VDEAFTAVLKVANALQKSKLEIDYIVPFSASFDSYGKPLDSYALSIVSSPLNDNSNNNYMFPLSFQRGDTAINPLAMEVISRKDLSLMPFKSATTGRMFQHIPQEQYFVNLLRDCWTNGGTIWNNNERVINKPV
jgi:hypothetical protein